MCFGVSSVFHVLFFLHEGNIFMIAHICYCIPLTISTTMRIMVPFIGDNPGSYESVGVGLFKISSLISFFPLPMSEIPYSSTIFPMHMTYSSTCGSHSSPNLWEVPSYIDVDLHGKIIPPLV